MIFLFHLTVISIPCAPTRSPIAKCSLLETAETCPLTVQDILQEGVFLCDVTQNRKYRARHNVTIISKYFRKYHSPELKKKIDFLAVYCLLEM